MREQVVEILGDPRLDLKLDGSLEPYVEKIILYLEAWKLWNSKINLTAEKTEEEVLRKHIFDSLQYVRCAPRKGQIMDLGSGAGFPGLPIKIIFPEIKLVMVESQRKRANFLREVVRKLDFDGVEINHERAESLMREYENRFQAVLLRNVEKNSKTLEAGACFLMPGGIMILQKDHETDPAEEMEGKNPPLSNVKLKNQIIILSYYNKVSKLVIFQKCST